MVAKSSGNSARKDAATWNCPICRKPVLTEAATFPFCSRQCKLVDLERWFNGEYSISRPIEPDEDLDDEDLGPGVG